MSEVHGMLREMHHHVGFYCPGCQETHVISLDRWTFDGNWEKPTLTPSLIVRTGHYAAGWKKEDSCWCEYYKEHPDKEVTFVCGICHSNVTKGEIQFHADSTHPLSGQLVAMEVPPDHG